MTFPDIPTFILPPFLIFLVLYFSPVVPPPSLSPAGVLFYFSAFYSYSRICTSEDVELRAWREREGEREKDMRYLSLLNSMRSFLVPSIYLQSS